MNAELEEVAEDAPAQNSSAPSGKKKKKKKKKKVTRDVAADEFDNAEAANMQAMNDMDEDERARELEEQERKLKEIEEKQRLLVEQEEKLI